MTVEAIYKNRDDFAEQVQAVASTDLQKMGLEIVSFTIKDVSDPNGYLDALGRPQIAEVKKDAEIAESNALRETRIKQAENEQLAQQEEIRRKTEIAEANKNMALKQAHYKQEQEVAVAQAEQVAVGFRCAGAGADGDRYRAADACRDVLWPRDAWAQGRSCRAGSGLPDHPADGDLQGDHARHRPQARHHGITMP